MDQYGKRLLAVAAMLGAVALSAVWIAGAAGPPAAQPAATGETVYAAAAQPDGEAIAPAFAADAPRYYVTLCTRPGAAVELTDLQGRHLQSLTADERGYATIQPIPPGQYRLSQGTRGGEFALLDNAAVSALSGTLWSDGELLHMADDETVRLTVQCSVSPAQRGRVVTVLLRGQDGTELDRSFVAGSAARYTVEFAGLVPGRYEVWQNETLLRSINVSNEPEQTLDLTQ